MTSPGYVPPSAVGWFVKKQNVFLDVTVTPSAEMAFAAPINTLAAVANPTAIALNDTDQSSTVTTAVAPSAGIGVKKRINRVGSVAKGSNTNTSLGSDAWSVSTSFGHTTPLGGVNRALVVAATASFHSYGGNNTLTSFTAEYAGIPMTLLGYAWHNGVSVVNNDASLTGIFGLLDPAEGANTLNASVAQGNSGSGNSYTHLVTAAASYVNVSEFGLVSKSWGWSTVPRLTTVPDATIVGNGDQYRTVWAVGESDVSVDISNMAPGSQLDYTETSQVGQGFGDAAGYSEREFTADSNLAWWGAVGVELKPVAS